MFKKSLQKKMRKTNMLSKASLRSQQTLQKLFSKLQSLCPTETAFQICEFISTNDEMIQMYYSFSEQNLKDQIATRMSQQNPEKIQQNFVLGKQQKSQKRSRYLEQIELMFPKFKPFLRNFNLINFKQFFQFFETYSVLPIIDKKKIKGQAIKAKNKFDKEAFKTQLLIVDSALYHSTKNQRLRITQALAIYCFVYNRKVQKLLLQILTGEGKSTTISCIAAILTMRSKKVDIVTTNSILATRDVYQKQGFYQLMGMIAKDNIQRDSNNTQLLQPRDCYKNQTIVYGTPFSYQVDLLYDQYKKKGTRNSRPYDTVIVDQVDSMFVDEKQNQTLLSSIYSGFSELKQPLKIVWQTIVTHNIIKQGGKFYLLKHGKNQGEIIKGQVNKAIRFIIQDLRKSFQNQVINQEKLQFIQLSIQNWVLSAIAAAHFYNQNVHYKIQSQKIIPIDLNNTGTLQKNVEWEDGLHQFLQLKHGLQVSIISLTSNYMSNIGLFSRYRNIYGVTGTLGSEKSMRFLYQTYEVQMMQIPPFQKRRLIIDPGYLMYQNKDWMKKILERCQTLMKDKRAILIICENIQNVQDFSQILSKRVKQIKRLSRIETGQEKIEDLVQIGDVIVATNVAGRGTDLKPTQNLIKNGGLHVIVTFMPQNSRVEMQARGRGGRNGAPGSSQLIVNFTNYCKGLNMPLISKNQFQKKGIGIQYTKSIRDELEMKLMLKDETRVQDIRVKDKMFEIFCSATNSVTDYQTNQAKKNAIQEQWGMFLKRCQQQSKLDYADKIAGAEQFSQKIRNDSQSFFKKSHCILRGINQLTKNENEKAKKFFIEAQDNQCTMNSRIAGSMLEGALQIQKNARYLEQIELMFPKFKPFLRNFNLINFKQFFQFFETYSVLPIIDKKKIKGQAIKAKNKFDKEAFKTQLLIVDSALYHSTKNQRLRITQALAIYCFVYNRKVQKLLLQILTGEGKSTTISCIAAILTMRSKKVDIVTTNSILATRDVYQKQGFYQLMGMIAKDNIQRDSNNTQLLQPRDCYKNQTIVYGTPFSYQVDLLYDQYKKKGTRNSRPYDTVIVDQVDSMFVDEKQNQTLLSSIYSGFSELKQPLKIVWQTIVTHNIIKQGGKFYLLKHGKNQGEIIKGQVNKAIRFIIQDLRKSFQNQVINQEKLQFIQLSIQNWVLSAIAAAHFYNQNVHYKIQSQKIIPIDLNNTGTLQKNVEWEDGLHQFLQLKHGLQVSIISLTSNYMSNIGLFSRYRNIYGVTGTLGSEKSMRFLYQTYEVQMMQIPPFQKRRLIIDPGYLMYQNKDWMKKILERCQTLMKDKRAILIICENIQNVQDFSQILSKRVKQIKRLSRIETGQEKIEDLVQIGDVIVATNVAGRGTDLKPTQNLIKNGGLHVIVTFMPQNSRVEMQARGRGGRNGAPGSSQLIVNFTNYCKGLNMPLISKNQFQKKGIGIQYTKSIRDELEMKLMLKDETRVQDIRVKDKMFEIFCSATNSVTDYQTNQAKKNAIQEQWGMFLKRCQQQSKLDYADKIAGAEQFSQKIRNDSQSFFKKSHCILRGINQLTKNENEKAKKFFIEAQDNQCTMNSRIAGSMLEGALQIQKNAQNIQKQKINYGVQKMIHDPIKMIEQKKQMIKGMTLRNSTIQNSQIGQLLNRKAEAQRQSMRQSLQGYQSSPINIKNYKKPQSLSLYESQSSSINIKNNKKPQSLSQNGSQSSSINIKNYKKPQSISLYESQSSSINIKNNKKPQSISQNGSQSSSINIKNYKKPQSISLYESQSSSINIKNNKKPQSVQSMDIQNYEMEKLVNNGQIQALDALKGYLQNQEKKIENLAPHQYISVSYKPLMQIIDEIQGKQQISKQSLQELKVDIPIIPFLEKKKKETHTWKRALVFFLAVVQICIGALIVSSTGGFAAGFGFSMIQNGIIDCINALFRPQQLEDLSKYYGEKAIQYAMSALFAGTFIYKQIYTKGIQGFTLIKNSSMGEVMKQAISGILQKHVFEGVSSQFTNQSKPGLEINEVSKIVKRPDFQKKYNEGLKEQKQIELKVQQIKKKFKSQSQKLIRETVKKQYQRHIPQINQLNIPKKHIIYLISDSITGIFDQNLNYQNRDKLYKEMCYFLAKKINQQLKSSQSLAEQVFVQFKIGNLIRDAITGIAQNKDYSKVINIAHQEINNQLVLQINKIIDNQKSKLESQGHNISVQQQRIKKSEMTLAQRNQQIQRFNQKVIAHNNKQNSFNQFMNEVTEKAERGQLIKILIKDGIIQHGKVNKNSKNFNRLHIFQKQAVLNLKDYQTAEEDLINQIQKIAYNSFFGIFSKALDEVFDLSKKSAKRLKQIEQILEKGISK